MATWVLNVNCVGWGETPEEAFADAVALHRKASADLSAGKVPTDPNTAIWSDDPGGGGPYAETLPWYIKLMIRIKRVMVAPHDHED